MPVDLWNFALGLYQRPGIEQACLRLQAEGADVCLLLCAAWLERRAVACNAERCAQLQSLARPWQETVVTPLRSLRLAWRGTATGDARLGALREQLKKLELEAERELLARLEAACRDWPAAATGDGNAWLEALAGPASGCRDALEILRAAAGREPA